MNEERKKMGNHFKIFYAISGINQEQINHAAWHFLLKLTKKFKLKKQCYIKHKTQIDSYNRIELFTVINTMHKY